MGMILVSTLISCPDPSTVPEALSLPSTPSQAEEEEAEGTIPLPWEVSLAYPSSRSYLDRYLSDGVVRITMPGEEGEASTSGRLAYPEIDPKGGPGAKFPLPSLSGKIPNKGPIFVGPTRCQPHHSEPTPWVHCLLLQSHGDGLEVSADPV